MSTEALPLDEWQLRFHEAMAAVLRAREAIRRQATLAGVAWGLWRAARDLKEVVDFSARLLETQDGLVTKEMVGPFMDSMKGLVVEIDGLVDTAKRRKLFNRTLTSAAIEAVRCRGEELAECVDALEMSFDAEVIELIRKGRQDFAGGRGVPLSSMRRHG
jgi:hypothetical protein